MAAPSRFGLAIDQETNDLFLDADSNLAVVRDAEAVGQHGRQRLMTYSGEWFLDTSAGVPWLGQIMGRNYNPALAESTIKAVLLDTDGIEEITSFSVSFNATPRQLDINSVSVMTDYDQEVDL